MLKTHKDTDVSPPTLSNSSVPRCFDSESNFSSILDEADADDEWVLPNPSWSTARRAASSSFAQSASPSVSGEKEKLFTNSVTIESKNHLIPLPLPISNLRKGRGRKVPVIVEPSTNSAIPLRRGRASGGPNEIEKARKFACNVPGCGRGFVRGEHLRRHVRSVHTYEKSHVCQHEGCGKSFSRRDNLARHFRGHMS